MAPLVVLSRTLEPEDAPADNRFGPDPRLYQLVRQPGRITDRTFEITFLEPGAQAYVFTFG